MPDLHELVDELDRLIPKEGARLKIPSSANGNTTAGTQRGYLRLGIELLRAGLAPIPETPSDVHRIPLDIEYLLTPGSDTPFDLCEIDEDIDRRPPPSQKLGPLGQLSFAVAAVIVLGLLVLGVAAALSRLF